MSDKLYRIGEASELLELKTYVLRFWETVFPQLEPLRTDKGQRLYSEGHIALLKRIKQLLHEQGMTIEGARRVLDGGSDVCAKETSSQQDHDDYLMILEELEALRNLLAKTEEGEGEEV